MRRRRQQEQSLYVNQYLGYNHSDRRDRDRPYELHYQHERGYGVCKYCSSYHRNESEKCYFVCHYCHSIHFKQQPDQKNEKINICPLLKTIALQQQNKKAYSCDQCGGNGHFEKIIQTTYIEPKQLFQRRLRLYQQLKKQNPQNKYPPERKVFKKREEIKSQKCQSCNSKGKQYRMVACCQNGCNECSYSKVKINPKWREMRAKGELNDEVFPCRICSEEVSVGDMIFKLHCGHTFHRSCIFSWLYRKQGCYTCTKVDPYLLKQDIPLQSLTKLSYVENMPKKFVQNLKIVQAMDKNKNSTNQRFLDKKTQISDSWGLVSNGQESFTSCVSKVKTNSINESFSLQPSLIQRGAFYNNQQEQQNDSLLITFKPPLQPAQKEELTLDLSIIQQRKVYQNVQNESASEQARNLEINLTLKQIENNLENSSWIQSEQDQDWAFQNHT